MDGEQRDLLADQGETPSVRAPEAGVTAMSDAVRAAFDAEIAMWDRAATDFRRRLARDSSRKLADYEAPQATSETNGDSISVSTQGTHSHSSSSAETPSNNHGYTSLRMKWDEVENILASLKPIRLRFAHNRALKEGRLRALQADISKLRGKTLSSAQTRSHKERAARCIEKFDPEVCRRVVFMWKDAIQALRRANARKTLADAHSKRRACLLVMKKWRVLCHTLRSRRAQDGNITRQIHLQLVKQSLTRWWVCWRWTRGCALLKEWSSSIRLRRSLILWRELVATVHAVQRLRRLADCRVKSDVLSKWKMRVVACRSKRRCLEKLRRHLKRRWFLQLRAGCHVSRERSASLKTAAQHRHVYLLRRAFAVWCMRTEEHHRKRVALKWWRHCKLSSCFDAWTLYHRSIHYRSHLHKRAASCHSMILTRRALKQWRDWVDVRHKLRDLLTRIAFRSIVRCVMDRLREAVAADHDRHRHLHYWRVQRCVRIWHKDSHQRARLNEAHARVKAAHDHRVLRLYAWSSWRSMFQGKLREKKLLHQARLFALRRWWNRWITFDSIVKADFAMEEILDAERKRRIQRRVYFSWRQYCHEQRNSIELQRTSDLHHSHVLLKKGMRSWIRFVSQRRREDDSALAADRLYLRHTLRTWKTRTAAHLEASGMRILRLKAMYLVWLKRLWLLTWKRHASLSIRGRRARLWRKWRVFVSNQRRDRQFQWLRIVMRLRSQFLALTRYVAIVKTHRRLVQQIEAASTQRLLHRTLVSKWREKTRRNSAARAILRTVIERRHKSAWLHRWRTQTRAAIGYCQAVSHHRHRLITRVFKRWYHNAIVRLRILIDRRQQRILKLMMNRWRQQCTRARAVKLAVHQVQRHRQQRTVHKWLDLLRRRRIRDEKSRRATDFYRSANLQRVFQVWRVLTLRRINSKHAAAVLITIAQRHFLARWRRALARQVYIRGLEAQYEHAWRRQAWQRLVGGVKCQQRARHAWLMQLSVLLIVKALNRWRRLMEIHRATALRADELRQRCQRRTLRRCFETWNQFVGVRAFVALRCHRTTSHLQAVALRHWKLHTMCMCLRRARLWRLTRCAFMAMKKQTRTRKAAATVAAQSLQRLLCATWQVWRVEFWVKMGLAISRNRLLRQVFQAWKEAVVASTIDSSDDSMQHQVKAGLTTPARFAFEEAMAFHQSARQQREMMTRVLSAWSLLTRASRRRRSRRSTIYSLSIAHDENMDPNTYVLAPTAKIQRRRKRKSIVEDEMEAMAIEFWARKLLETAFSRWQLHCVYKNLSSPDAGIEDWPVSVDSTRSTR